jgi:hypothetical protein
MGTDHESLGPAGDGGGSNRVPVSDSWDHIRTLALVVTFIAIVYAVAAVGYYSGLIEGLRALPVTTESEL